MKTIEAGTESIEAMFHSLTSGPHFAAAGTYHLGDDPENPALVGVYMFRVGAGHMKVTEAFARYLVYLLNEHLMVAPTDAEIDEFYR